MSERDISDIIAALRWAFDTDDEVGAKNAAISLTERVLRDFARIADALETIAATLPLSRTTP